jgi:hypothetical protein
VPYEPPIRERTVDHGASVPLAAGEAELGRPIDEGDIGARKDDVDALRIVRQGEAEDLRPDDRRQIRFCQRRAVRIGIIDDGAGIDVRRARGPTARIRVVPIHLRVRRVSHR